MKLFIELVLAVIIFAVLNIWLLWWVALLIALVVVFGGFLIIAGDAGDIFD
jgi:hypothetical protein